MNFNDPLARKRDVLNFLNTRPATSADDASVGDFLVNTFNDTYAEKLPDAVLNPDREADLRDVASRRRDGGVWVVELGYQLVATFSVLKPGTEGNDAWLPEAALLRCVAVDRLFHGLRFSSLILESSKTIATEWRASHLCLHVQRGAQGVARTYEKFGYVRDVRGDNNFLGSMVEGYALNLRPDIYLLKTEI
ncbi:MAG: GNAT family N-acetyltransferase [Bdellovibrionales bacterium]|nr:GNAT family N-acetyltransferase [Bdellovibrionales bacterium]